MQIRFEQNKFNVRNQTMKYMSTKIHIQLVDGLW